MTQLDDSDTYTCKDCGGLYHGMYDICPKRLDDSKNTSPSETPSTLPNTEDVMELDEILDWVRFEQEWIAMDAKDHDPKTKHEKTCGVCVKMRVLNESAKSKLTKHIEQQVLIGRIDEIKVWLEATETSNGISTPLVNDTSIVRAMENRLTKLRGELNDTTKS